MPENSNTYFAADTAEEAVNTLNRKASDWFDAILENNYLEKVRLSWDAYHGAYYGNGHQISWGGEQGELVNLAVNHYRNIARHILNMITANRPAFQARATNSDSKSEIQTELANGLLEYYMREKRLERFLMKAVEYAVVLGTGYIKMEWSATSGQIYDYYPAQDTIDPKTGETVPGKPQPIYEGDVIFRNLTPFDVVFDSTKESSEENDWVLVRTFKNKFDLAAKYPEQAEEIKNLRTKSQLEKNRLSRIYDYDQTVDVPVYEFFHKRTESLPNGRYILYLSTEVILEDTILMYRALPVYRISASDILGTQYGYSPMFDLLPLQNQVNSIYSTVATNQNAFGVQNILNPRGNDVRVNQLEGSLNFIEYTPVPNSPSGGRPEALNLTQTPPEIFNFLQMLVRDMETISGVNSVARGNPESSLKSGSALALVQSQALQFMSTLQQSYIQLIEDVGTGLINLLRDFASVPRIAAISGINNRMKMVNFSGDDLDYINRVLVDVGNPLAQCLGKDTPVLMYDGSIKMVQDIKINDLIMGPDSKPRTVSNVNSGKEQMYEISSKNEKRDITYKANQSHILTLKYCSDDVRYDAKKGDQIDISIRDYLKLSERQRNLLQGFKTGVEFGEKTLEIPAYILGSWIGDGSSKAAAITTADEEIKNEWLMYSDSIGMNFRTSTSENSGKAKTYFITSSELNGKSDRNDFINKLRNLKVWGNKHIPQIYLNSSADQRLELLAGLIDTDGSLTDETFIFTQKSDVIANQVVFLAESLGFRVNIKKITREGFNVISEINKISIGGDTWRIPTRLKRKQANKVIKSNNWLNYGITVTPIEEDTYYGFTLKEEPHFVLGNFVVTHNTTAGRVQMAEQLLQMKLIQSPEKYIEVMNTGKLSGFIDNTTNEIQYIRRENEALLNGDIQVQALLTDQHSLHIREHRVVLADPQVKFNDPEVVQRTLAHIQEHIDLLRNTDPNLLQIFGEQPLPPVNGNPIGPQQPQGVPQDAANAGPMLQNPQAGGVGAGPNALPQPGAGGQAANPGSILPQPAQAPQQAPNGANIKPGV